MSEKGEIQSTQPILFKYFMGMGDTPELDKYAQSASASDYLVLDQGVVVQDIYDRIRNQGLDSENVVIRFAGGMLNNCIARTAKELAERGLNIQVNIAHSTYKGNDLEETATEEVIEDRIKHFKLSIKSFEIPEDKIEIINEPDDIRTKKKLWHLRRKKGKE